MNEDAVIVFRDESDSDIIGVLAGDDGDLLGVLHPYYIHHNTAMNTIMMMPYCVFSDNILYAFPKTKLKFVVPASTEVSKRFIKMILDPLERVPDGKVVAEGNDTKH